MREKVGQAHNQGDYGDIVTGTNSDFWGFQKLQERPPQLPRMQMGWSQTSHLLTAPGEQEASAVRLDQENQGLSAPLTCRRTSRIMPPSPQKTLLHQILRPLLQTSPLTAWPFCSSPTPPHRISGPHRAGCTQKPSKHQAWSYNDVLHLLKMYNKLK